MTEVPRSNQPSVVLTIAGFDPGSGAGVTADLQVFATHGLFGTACVTALTVQSTVGVARIEAIRPQLLQDMLQHLVTDMPPAGIKVGMLGNAAITQIVADFLRVLRHQDRAIPVIVDPVLRSSSGKLLLADDAIGVLKEQLFPLARCITPNRSELAVLLGRQPLAKEDLVEAASELLARSGAQSVIVTGGDADQPIDLLLEPSRAPIWLTGNRIKTDATHGTGCAFSSALLSQLVLGHDLPEAAKQAKRFVERSLHGAPGLGSGRGPMKLSAAPFASSKREAGPKNS